MQSRNSYCRWGTGPRVLGKRTDLVVRGCAWVRGHGAQVAQIGGAVGHHQHVALGFRVAVRRATAAGGWGGHERRLSRAHQPSHLPRMCL